MSITATMNLADAAAYADAFASVEAGTATTAQLEECHAVRIALHHYLRDVGDTIDKARAARKAFMDALPEGKRTAVTNAADGKNAAGPRVWWDGEAKSIVTPETASEIEALKAARTAPAPAEEEPAR